MEGGEGKLTSSETILWFVCTLIKLHQSLAVLIDFKRSPATPFNEHRRNQRQLIRKNCALQAFARSCQNHTLAAVWWQRGTMTHFTAAAPCERRKIFTLLLHHTTEQQTEGNRNCIVYTLILFLMLIFFFFFQR